MKSMSFSQKISTGLMFFFSCGFFNANAALHIHSELKTPASAPQKEESFYPENQTVVSRVRDQKLRDSLNEMTKHKMNIKFVNSEIGDMHVDWRSKGEPLQIVLTKLARIYGLDIVMNKVTETIYVDVDKGQCSVHRDASLLKTQRQWQAMNINKMPTLPAFLPVYLDASGFEWRLC